MDYKRFDDTDLDSRQQQQQARPSLMENDQKIVENSSNKDESISFHGENTVEEVIAAFNDFKGVGDNQLSFKKSDELRILKKTTDTWWWAELDGCYGYVPVNHLKSEKHVMWQDEEYFGNYSNLKIHHEMLSDRPRTLAYMNAIISNSCFLTGKVILDVGCGTGVISMMCAKHAHPKMIYAVEASDIAVHTIDVIEQNGMSDKVKVLHGYAENIELPEKVDVIISEWMGTMLLFEMMIESVIHMRDRYLQEDGMLWPSTASLFLVPCSAHDQYSSKVHFWDNQFGFDFSCLKSVAKEDLLCKPLHDYLLPQDDCLSEEVKLLQLDMKTVTVQYLEEIICDFNFCIKKARTMHGFCAWFEVGFDPYTPDGEEVVLNTGPYNELTHWKQDLFLLDEPVHVEEDDKIVGSVILTRNPDYRRHLRAEYQFTIISGDKTVSEHRKKFFIWR